MWPISEENTLKLHDFEIKKIDDPRKIEEFLNDISFELKTVSPNTIQNVSFQGNCSKNLERNLNEDPCYIINMDMVSKNKDPIKQCYVYIPLILRHYRGKFELLCDKSYGKLDENNLNDIISEIKSKIAWIIKNYFR